MINIKKREQEIVTTKCATKDPRALLYDKGMTSKIYRLNFKA